MLSGIQDGTAACIKAIRRLGEPVEALQEEFLTSQAARMRIILGEAAVIVQVLHVASCCLCCCPVQG